MKNFIQRSSTNFLNQHSYYLPRHFWPSNFFTSCSLHFCVRFPASFLSLVFSFSARKFSRNYPPLDFTQFKFENVFSHLFLSLTFKFKSNLQILSYFLHQCLIINSPPLSSQYRLFAMFSRKWDYFFGVEEGGGDWDQE